MILGTVRTLAERLGAEIVVYVAHEHIDLLARGIAETRSIPHRGCCQLHTINTRITESSPLRGRHATPAARATIVRLYQRRNYGPDRVAASILRAVRKNRPVAPVSPEAWAMYFLKRLAPGLTARLNRALAARVQRQVERVMAEGSET